MAVPGEVADRSRIASELVSLTGASGALSAYLARPQAADDGTAGIIVIHEAFGLNDHIRDIADRFANVGFVAIAPDLYSRSPLPAEPTMEDAFRAMFSLADESAVADLQACADHLRSTGLDKVAVIGFCSGGRQALMFACSTAAVDAAIACWGGFIDRANPDSEVSPTRPVPPATMVDRLRVPMLLVGGAEDANPSPALLERIASTASATSPAPVEVRIYEGAGHAFLADYRPTYREAQAFELWTDIVNFLQNHVG